MLHVVIFVKFVAVLSISIIRLWLTSISMKLYFKIWQLIKSYSNGKFNDAITYKFFLPKNYRNAQRFAVHVSLGNYSLLRRTFINVPVIWSGRKGRGGLPSVLILHLSRSITDDKTDGKLQLNRQNCWEILRVTSNIFLFKD